MSTDYPGAIDTLTNPSGTDQLSSPSHSGQHADANDAIEAIQTELGVNPAGSMTDVAERLGAHLLSTEATVIVGSGQNNYNPAGLGVKGVLNLNPSASIGITGFAAQEEGFMFILINHSATNTLDLRHEDAASTDVNRIRTDGGVNRVIPVFGSAILLYASSRWRLVSRA